MITTNSNHIEKLYIFTSHTDTLYVIFFTLYVINLIIYFFYIVFPLTTVNGYSYF